MFGQRKKDSEEAHSWETALVSAAANSMAVIRFQPDGTIIDANKNFLAALGYTLQEVQGKHHRIFVDPVEAASPAYHGFWPALAKGVIEAGEFRRITKRGQEIWISASYTPILDAQGKVVQIVKFAQDITARKLASLSLVASLERLSQGDFSVRMKNAQGGSEAELQKSFNYTVEKLDQMVKGIVEGTGSLDMVTSDVENFSRRLSSDTSKQEHELSEIREAVNQIASQLDATVAAVGRLEADADVSAKRALAGATIVGQAVDAIRSIESLAREVSQNTEVIESFAFQTNLLSLNAAVEAARAGDAGLGFAVVAAEVRALANKSREASQIIADLTRRCEAEVVQGTKLIESAGLALSEIQETAAAVAQATASISAGSQDQSRGIKMVEQSMARIDSSVQGVVNLSRDGDQQAVRLKSETSKLRHLVQSFVQDQSTRQAHPTAVMRAAS